MSTSQSQSNSQSQSLASLTASVTSLRSSLSLLDSSISILDAGISDFPRLKKVLSSTRHFELTPSSSLQTAQKSLAAELLPAITTLLTRSEVYLAKMERRQLALVARAELLEGRLEGGQGSAREVRRVRSLERIGRGGGGGGGGSGRGNEEKLRMLRQKKERLGYAVERLTLQSQQRQRQLRMSVAAT